MLSTPRMIHLEIPFCEATYMIFQQIEHLGYPTLGSPIAGCTKCTTSAPARNRDHNEVSWGRMEMEAK